MASISQDRIIEKLRRKALKAKPCPFCGYVPEFKFRIESSQSGKYGHYALRKGCCRATCLGQTGLFFHETVSLGTFKGMAHRLLKNWNQREGESK